MTAQPGIWEDFNERLKSFSSWPSSFVTPKDLAEAGFYYTGHKDLVQCFQCQLELENWQPGDIPLKEHRVYKQDCQFVLTHGMHDIQISGPPTPLEAKEKEHVEVGDTDESDTILQSKPSSGQHGVNALHKFGMASYNDRLASFATWKKTSPTPHVLAYAGFFYEGPGDRVKCYSCHGTMEGWGQHDNPILKHNEYFPNCELST